VNRVWHRLAFLPAMLLLAAPASTSPVADPELIVRAERAFAARVRQLGVRAGFLDWLSPTGVVFRPGPVMGHTSYEQQPIGWNGLLAWHPLRAAISADGTVGWSTGPWTWRRDSTARKADSYGEYMTVWRRQADGSYKVALDCGIGHAEPIRVEPALSYSNPVRGANLGSRPLAARQSLYQADASFARYAATEGVAGAIARYATDDIIALREGAQRFVGRATVHDSIAVREREAKLVSNAQYISDSGDLGYTYGSFVTGSPVVPDSAYYVHVWHRGAAATWRLAFEVVMPVPKPKQK
jgi:ketosteroid isomerase-like protein